MTAYAGQPLGAVRGSKEEYSQQTQKLLHQIWLQEEVATLYLRKLQVIDTLTSALSILTASGSTVAGWALWEKPGARELWVLAAGLAAVSAVFHMALNVRTRTKTQEQLRGEFARLRVQAQTFLNNLLIKGVTQETEDAFDRLQKDRAKIEPKAEADILITRRLTEHARATVDGRVRAEINFGVMPSARSHSQVGG